MAAFSKQYVVYIRPDLYKGWDFDIEEVAKDLEPNQSIKMICEGFGFSWISKNEEGEIQLIFIDLDTGKVTYKTLEELINTRKNGI